MDRSVPVFRLNLNPCLWYTNPLTLEVRCFGSSSGLWLTCPLPSSTSSSTYSVHFAHTFGWTPLWPPYSGLLSIDTERNDKVMSDPRQMHNEVGKYNEMEKYKRQREIREKWQELCKGASSRKHTYMSKWLKEWMDTYNLAMKYEVLSILNDSEKYAIRDFMLAIQNSFASFYIRCWGCVEMGWLAYPFFRYYRQISKILIRRKRNCFSSSDLERHTPGWLWFKKGATKEVVLL